MSDNKHSRLFRGRGYYIALILCAAAIGITSYVYNMGREPEAVQTVNTPAAIEGTAALPTRDTTPTESAETPTVGKIRGWWVTIRSAPSSMASSMTVEKGSTSWWAPP